MSSKGRSPLAPVAHEFFGTPPWCVDRLLDRRGDDLGRWMYGDPARWLEPCAGSGAIVHAVAEWLDRRGYGPHPTWTTVDIRPKAIRPPRITELGIGSHHVGDFLAGFAPQSSMLHRPLELGGFDLSLSNPPFGLAFDFVRRALQLAPVVVYLLRMSWLGSDERAEWLRAHTPSVYMLPERPSFTGEGRTDSDYYAWMAWGLDEVPMYQVLDSTPLAIRKRGRRRRVDPRQLGLLPGGCA